MMRYIYSKRRPPIADREKVPVKNRVRFYRRLRGWSQKRLAEEIDAHVGMIYQIENRLVAPKITTVFKLAEVFDVEPLHLFFKPGEKPPVHFDGELLY